MKDYVFTELGYFSARECQAIKDTLEGQTFMRFHIKWSSHAGNCTLIVATDYESTEDEIKHFFLGRALSAIFELRRNCNG